MNRELEVVPPENAAPPIPGQSKARPNSVIAWLPVAAIVGMTTITASAQSYDLAVEAGYDFNVVSSSGLYSASPDSSFVIIKNNGPAPFVGELRLDGVALNTSMVADTSGLILLPPGGSWTLVGGPEASNQGGFNKNQAGTDPNGPPDNGLLLSIKGSSGNCEVNFQVYDKDIHSGIFNGNPFGIVLDNYILQGGDPFGQDTGDDYEVNTQQHAFFNVSGTCCELKCPEIIVVANDPGECGAKVEYQRPELLNCPTDRVIDADGDVTPGDGIPGAVEVFCGAPLTRFTGRFNAVGLDMFDNDLNGDWTFGPAGDDLHFEDPTVCSKANRNGRHDLGLDCKVLDYDGSLADGQPVTCDLEVQVPFITACPPKLKFYDLNGNLAYDPGEDIVYDANNNGIFDCPEVVCAPPPGFFPVGCTFITCAAVSGDKLLDKCEFQVCVRDTEGPRAACVPTVNPAGGNVPNAGAGQGSNPKSGKNPDGFYQLQAKDNCDGSNLAIYIKDGAEGPCGGAFSAGPYKPGDKVKLTQSPNSVPVAKKMAGVIVAHVITKGEPVLVVTDSYGNTTCHPCFVPPPPK